MEKAVEGYDIIGDIHGHAEELIKLLMHMGYRDKGEGYQHEHRQVIFLGDFIDRGEKIAQHRVLLDTVMKMVRNGHAQAVMGNHEFNALAYHTLHNGEYLRAHSDKNRKQHQAFLNEYEDDLESKQKVLDFFYTLPLWLDLGGIRVIHACWDQTSIDTILKVSTNALISPELLIKSSEEGSDEYKAVERLLKGVEIELPDGMSFFDKDKNERREVRVQWWRTERDSLAELVLPLDLDIKDQIDGAVPNSVPTYPSDQPPCFIGHYWMQGIPRPLTNNVACLDYSIAASKNSGKLVAYRWQREKTLKVENYTWVENNNANKQE